MTAVLGVSAQYHDAAAALVVDGVVVAAVQQERLSRLKHDASLPIEAAMACLRLGGVEPRALDRVMFHENPYAKLERVLVSSLGSFPRGVASFPRAMASQLGGKLWVLDALAARLGVDRQRIGFTDHHRAHAASAFFVSPYPRAAVLTVDGVGEDVCSAVWLGDGRSLQCVGTQRFPHSLGLLYAAFTAYLGFQVNEGELQVMGLAAHGAPRFREPLAQVARLHADGTLELEPSFFAEFQDDSLAFGPKLEALFGPRRPYGRPWSLAHPDDRRWADIAATLQQFTEEAMLSMATWARERTAADALCLAGGVALNCGATARLAAESGFSRVFVQPAASDAGGALGAAILGALELGDPRPAPMRSAALGEPVDLPSLHATAQQLGVPFEHTSDPASTALACLERGEVIGFVEGRFEWGPRALGHRSILASPAAFETRDRVNRAVKQREPFRPFAPSVLRDAASEWFIGEAPDLTPFMTTLLPVRPERRARLEAVVHEDGTSRVQTVSGPGPFFELLRGAGRALGAPALLNTSLNGPGEPMAASGEDALAFFLAHPIDALIVEDLVFHQRRSR